MKKIETLNPQKGRVVIGERCSIGEGVKIIFAGEGSVSLGDYVTLGEGVKIVVEGGDVVIGDWCTIHPNSTVFCKNGVSIGDHCWFGQNSVIDGTGGLTIERGVRVGMFSQIWTHVAAGEQIEGCFLFGEAPTHIEADVWLVGTCTVGSGVRIGRRTIALAGSNIVKSCEPNSVLAGAPAKLKEGLSFYKTLSLDQKFDLLREWLTSASFLDNFDAEVDVKASNLTVYIKNKGSVLFFKNNADYENHQHDGTQTICCLESKTYKKRLSDAEHAVLKYLSGNKARFYCKN